MMKSVSIVTTVFNEVEGCRDLLVSMADQTSQPDEIIVVDGGSTDGTIDVIRDAARVNKRIKLIEAPGVNIGRGRNIGIEHARGDVIASTDSGCRLDKHWLANLVKPFEDHRRAEFVAGVYRINPQSLLERVIGTATMRGALDPFDPATFNPSARSMAFTKALWRRAGGIPEFINIDDTLFDQKIRSLNVRWEFAGDAVVHWRPRKNFRSLARQFHFYGCGGGHTQIFATSSLYNVRNIALIVITAIASIWQPWLIALAAALFFYFYVFSHHRRSVRVMRKVGDWRAYFLTLAVQWTVAFFDATGYITGTVQRFVNPTRYRDEMDAYLRFDGASTTPTSEVTARTLTAPVGGV